MHHKAVLKIQALQCSSSNIIHFSQTPNVLFSCYQRALICFYCFNFIIIRYHKPERKHADLIKAMACYQVMLIQQEKNGGWEGGVFWCFFFKYSSRKHLILQENLYFIVLQANCAVLESAIQREIVEPQNHEKF